MKLNVKKLRKEKNTIIVSSKEALKDVSPIEWSKEVISGDKKVEIRRINN
ncbi:hypothetical protein [Terrisporobacter petrolearius]|nr:hypothetical protein [Terrisporobacter petrolearius]MCC3866416.1 hypothetical protein [Terrisporobacter petrolearius]SFJ29976.1 hypothetical protein SAMN02910355_2072 [Terrisporobacter glycolicus]